MGILTTYAAYRYGRRRAEKAAAVTCAEAEHDAWLCDECAKCSRVRTSHHNRKLCTEGGKLKKV